MMTGIFFELAVPVAVTANIFAYLLFGFDKWKAVRKEWRVPERTLLLSAFLAPFGAVTGMVMFRHKIRTPKFIIFVPLFALLQAMLIIMVLS
jgi:uncharacterized membrane protein YsdA (DUF1294 family)